MSMKVEVADHFWVEERHRVGGDGVAKPRPEFLGDCGAADHGTPLQHGDLQPGRGEIGSADQAVVPPADHDGIFHGRPSCPRTTLPRGTLPRRSSFVTAASPDAAGTWPSLARY